MLLEGRKEYLLSSQYNSEAALLFEGLARPALAFTIELAQAHTLRGRTLQAQGERATAEEEYKQAVGMLASLARSDAARERRHGLPRAIRRGAVSFGNTAPTGNDFRGARVLFSQAVEQHASAGSEAALCFDYYWLARANLDLDATDQAQQALDKLAAALSRRPDTERAQLDVAAAGDSRRNWTIGNVTTVTLTS